MLDALTADDFDPHVGSAFTVEVDEDQAALQLVEVQRLHTQPGAPREHPFVLRFSGPTAPALAQQIHRLHHPIMAVLDVFLVPVQPAGDALPRYEAVFN